VSNLSREKIDNSLGFDKEIGETLNHRIRWPFTELPKRYTRGDFGILLKRSGKGYMFDLGEFALAIEFCLFPEIHPSGRKTDFGAGVNNNQFPMLIKSIHVMDDEQKVIRNIGPSMVRLHVFDQLSDSSVRDCLYFSVVSFE
jgi:hypothetical protein